jgi:exodeoxyribonuclease-3
VSLTIASFNVNSLRARLANILGWLNDAKPDVALLQEIKCQENEFPRLEIESLGYQVAIAGQKSYNGVAILSKAKFDLVERSLPGDESDVQARYLEAIIDHPDGQVWKSCRVATIYLPNGNPVESEKYPYKLAWMRRLRDHAANLLRHEQPVVLGGDYNICPTDLDVYDPVGWADDALCRPQSREQFRAIVNLGYTDAFRVCNSEGHRYTFWDYQAGRWQRDEGLRIDHLLLSPQAADHLEDCQIDRKPRMLEKPSDHTPIWCRLAL